MKILQKFVWDIADGIFAKIKKRQIKEMVSTSPFFSKKELYETNSSSADNIRTNKQVTFWDGITNSLVSHSIFRMWDNCSFDYNKDIETSLWNSTDNLGAYESNKNQKYTKTEITYHLNGNGFRLPTDNQTQSVDNNEFTVACFGCSLTLGVGVKYEETWPAVLEQTLNSYNRSVVCKNYGVSGASSDMISRLVCGYLAYNKPKAVCCVLPDIFRREIYDEKTGEFEPYNVLFSYEKDKTPETKCAEAGFGFKQWSSYMELSNEHNNTYNFIKNALFIDRMCASAGVPCLLLTWDENILASISKGAIRLKSFCLNMSDLKDKYKNWNPHSSCFWYASEENANNWTTARDGVHFGKGYHAQVSEIFSDKLVSLL